MPAAAADPRRIIITGASSGLGRGLALSYARPGVSLGLIGRDPARLEAAAEDCRRLGAQVEAACIDVADAEALQDWALAFEAAGPVDLVIANAGTSGSCPDEASTDGLASASHQIRTNLLGAVHTVEPLTGAMIARGRGQIAVVASTAAYRGIPYMPAYAASKAGVRTYGEALRALLAPHGIAVTVVVPSFFESRMTDRYHGAKPMLVSGEAAVARVRKGLYRRQARVVFPRRMGLLMQVLDLIPGKLGDALLRANRFRIDP